MKLVNILILTAVSVIQPAIADPIDPAKQAAIDKLLQQSGQSAVAVGKQFSELYFAQISLVMKKTRPEIDPRAYDILQEVIENIIQEEFVENGGINTMMYPIYDQHFTIDELNEIIAFNETELGQKLIRVMPVITAEGMRAGRKLAESTGPLIEQRLKKRFEEEGIE